MAQLETTTAAAAFTPAEPGTVPGLFISLPLSSSEALEEILALITLAFPGQNILVASPNATPENLSSNGIQFLSYEQATASQSSWVVTATDYVNTYRLAKEHQATTCLFLGAEAQSLHPGAIRELALAATHNDLAMACYDLSPREALVNSALLYPVMRAIYGARPRFPLAIDLGLSLRMAERLAASGQKFVSVNQGDALLWPVAEACAANFSVVEIEAGTRTLPQPSFPDLNSLLAQVAGSLFTDIELKASHWQRARGAQPPRELTAATSGESMVGFDTQPMIDSFRLAYTNLHEIWSLVLPPNSLLSLKKLSLMPPTSFRMPDALWARIVYDFIVAYRLRTINRGHLLGALTPLYLAWVASHILLVNSGMRPEEHVEAQAIAFETDKPYLVSRWRWPDRFNP